MKTRDREIIYTSSSGLADDLNELYLRLGMRSSVTRRPLKGSVSWVLDHWAESSVDGYVVSASPPTRIKFRPENMQWVDYDGMVYCATVPNGCLLTRRNGYSLWSGNSGIPDAIFSVADGYFTEPILDRYWFTFSNGRRSSGYFYECHQGAKRAFWNTRNIDARTVEGTDTRRYEQIIEEYGEDSNEARVEVYGEFPAQNDEQMFPIHAIDEAMRRPAWNDPTAPVVMGVDPARGGDTTVLRVRRGRDLIAKRRYNSGDLMVVVGHIIEAIQEFSPAMTVIDEAGLGFGVVDRLREQGYVVRGFNFGSKATKPQRFQNKRAEVYHACAEWLRTASVPFDAKLKKDLLMIRKGDPTSKGQMTLVSKDDMAYSPDDADALVMTFAVPLGLISTPVDMPPPTPYADTPRIVSWMGH